MNFSSLNQSSKVNELLFNPPTTSQTPEGFNAYLGSVLMPQAYESRYPDGSCLPSTTKKLLLSKLYSYSVGTLGTGGLMFLMDFADSGRPVKIFRLNPASSQYHFESALQFSEDISQSYIRARLVSGILSLLCDTRPGGNFDVSGKFDAIMMSPTPLDFTTLDFSSALAQRMNEAAVRVQVPVMSGVTALCPITNDPLYRFYGGAVQLEKSRFTLPYDNVPTVISQYFPVANILVAPTVIFRSQLTLPLNAFFDPRVQVADQLIGEWIIEVALELTAGNITSLSMALDNNTIVAGAFSTTTVVNLNPAVASSFFATRSIFFDAPLTQVTITAQASASTSFKCSVRLIKTSPNADTISAPKTLIYLDNIPDNLSLSLSAVANFECIPTPFLSKNIKVDYTPNDTAEDMVVTERVFSAFTQNGFNFVYTNEEYAKLISAVDRKFFNREYHYGFAGMKDVLKEGWKHLREPLRKGAHEAWSGFKTGFKDQWRKDHQRDQGMAMMRRQILFQQSIKPDDQDLQRTLLWIDTVKEGNPVYPFPIVEKEEIAVKPVVYKPMYGELINKLFVNPNKPKLIPDPTEEDAGAGYLSVDSEEIVVIPEGQAMMSRVNRFAKVPASVVVRKDQEPVLNHWLLRQTMVQLREAFVDGRAAANLFQRGPYRFPVILANNDESFRGAIGHIVPSSVPLNNMQGQENTVMKVFNFNIYHSYTELEAATICADLTALCSILDLESGPVVHLYITGATQALDGTGDQSTQKGTSSVMALFAYFLALDPTVLYSGHVGFVGNDFVAVEKMGAALMIKHEVFDGSPLVFIIPPDEANVVQDDILPLTVSGINPLKTSVHSVATTVDTIIAFSLAQRLSKVAAISPAEMIQYSAGRAGVVAPAQPRQARFQPEENKQQREEQPSRQREQTTMRRVESDDSEERVARPLPRKAEKRPEAPKQRVPDMKRQQKLVARYSMVEIKEEMARFTTNLILYNDDALQEFADAAAPIIKLNKPDSGQLNALFAKHQTALLPLLSDAIAKLSDSRNAFALTLIAHLSALYPSQSSFVVGEETVPRKVVKKPPTTSAVYASINYLIGNVFQLHELNPISIGNYVVSLGAVLRSSLMDDVSQVQGGVMAVEMANEGFINLSVMQAVKRMIQQNTSDLVRYLEQYFSFEDLLAPREIAVAFKDFGRRQGVQMRSKSQRSKSRKAKKEDSPPESEQQSDFDEVRRVEGEDFDLD